MNIDSREHAEFAARYYAEGRQDGAGEPTDTTKVDAFVKVFAAMWQTYHDEHSYYRTNLEHAYNNWQERGHPYPADECGGCGRRHTGPGAQPERCAKCVESAELVSAGAR